MEFFDRPLTSCITMVLNKYNYQSDAIVNLYRAALYLARGSKDVGLQFLVKARAVLGDQLDPKINSLIDDEGGDLKNKESYRFWAEKILDQYKELRYSLR